DQDESWAVDNGRARDVEPFRDRADQMRLARAERSDKRDDGARKQKCGQSSAQRFGLVKAPHIDNNGIHGKLPIGVGWDLRKDHFPISRWPLVAWRSHGLAWKLSRTRHH